MMDYVTVYRGAGVYDATGLAACPGDIAVLGRKVRSEDGAVSYQRSVLAAGEESQVRRAAGKPDEVVDLSSSVLLPAMVNAHAHLDLSLIGALPYEGDFTAWIEQVIRHRASQPFSVAEAVGEGLRLSRGGGVGWIGDIAGSVEAVAARIEARDELHVPGVTWLECIGRGERGAQSGRLGMDALSNLKSAASAANIRLAIQPHAPYSTAAEIFHLASTLGGAATHLAETPEEERFIREAAGPFADLLRKLGRWHESITPSGRSPVHWFTDVVGSNSAVGARATSGWVVAHCNYVSDHDISLLRDAHASIAYCPIASEYFRHPAEGRAAHRYRDMIAAGINVCLGTDSIICQSTGEEQPLAILPAMRRLFIRDGVSPATLLKMATTNGLRALGLPPRLATFTRGVPAQFFAVRVDASDTCDPLQQALMNRYPVERIGF